MTDRPRRGTIALMCLGAIGQVQRVWNVNGLEMALVSFEGREATVCLACTPEARPGSTVLVHSGLAVEILDESTTLATDELRREAAAHGQTEE